MTDDDRKPAQLFTLRVCYQQLLAVLEIGPSGSDAITLTIKLARQQ